MRKRPSLLLLLHLVVAHDLQRILHRLVNVDVVEGAPLALIESMSVLPVLLLLLHELTGSLTMSSLRFEGTDAVRVVSRAMRMRSSFHILLLQSQLCLILQTIRSSTPLLIGSLRHGSTPMSRMILLLRILQWLVGMIRSQIGSVLNLSGRLHLFRTGLQRLVEDFSRILREGIGPSVLLLRLGQSRSPQSRMFL